jgi:hypothetical protein
MNYRIEFHGWGVELIVGSCTEKMYNHFKENDIDVTDHMCGNMEDELSKDIHEGLTEDTKYDNDNLYHNFGPYLNSNTTMRVFNENEEEVYCCSMEYKTGYKWDTECEQEIIVQDFDDQYVMIGQEHSKGYQAEYILELKEGEEFDANKLVVLYEDFDESTEIITGLRYNHVDLQCTGDLSTTGKGGCWYIQNNETGEQTRW